MHLPQLLARPTGNSNLMIDYDPPASAGLLVADNHERVHSEPCRKLQLVEGGRFCRLGVVIVRAAPFARSQLGDGTRSTFLGAPT